MINRIKPISGPKRFNLMNILKLQKNYSQRIQAQEQADFHRNDLSSSNDTNRHTGYQNEQQNYYFRNERQSTALSHVSSFVSHVSSFVSHVSTIHGASSGQYDCQYTEIHQNSFHKFAQEFAFLTFLPYPEFKNILQRILLKIQVYEMKKSFLVQAAHLLLAKQIEYGNVVCKRQHVGGEMESSIETRTKTIETRRKELQTKKIMDFMRFIKTMKHSRSKVNQQSKSHQLINHTYENTPDTLIQDSFQLYHFSNRIFLIIRVLYSMGFDIQESMFLVLLKSTMIHPDHFLLVEINQHESTMIPNQILNESDRLDFVKWIETRDNYFWKSIYQVENWIKDVQATYTPSMLSHLIESYLSIRKWNTAFGKLMDAKNKANEIGGISVPDLTDIYTMVLKKCQFEKSPCLYIVAELRFDMVREGVVIQGELGSALVQCCITAGDYSACVELLREWDPVKENISGDEELRETLIELFPNRK